LRELRKTRGWSRADIAKKSGVSIQNICRLEQSDKRVDTKTLGFLSDTLGVPASVLLGERTCDLSRYVVNPCEEKALREFLDQLISFANKAELLERLKQLIQVKTPKEFMREQRTGILIIEEILGRWTSLILAYENADWEGMRQHAERLVEMAGELNRPQLAYLAHAYAAKAFRNIGTQAADKQAEFNIAQIPEDSTSFVVLRLRAKILSSKKEYEQAISFLRKGVELITQQRERNDYLYAVEKVKLFRNLARCHMELAWENTPENKPLRKLTANVNDHLDEARKYLGQASRSLKGIKIHSQRAYDVEKMLLHIAQARLAQKCGKYPEAIEKAYMAIGLAGAADAPYGKVKMLMFLVHCYSELGQLRQAYPLYLRLKAEYARLPHNLRASFDHWVDNKLEKRLKEYGEKHGTDQLVPAVYRPGKFFEIDDQSLRKILAALMVNEGSS
jgi:transcriptional regulator with XRE-family HTH domain